jgi:hypothetical protein
MPVIDTEGKWKYNSNSFVTSALEGVAWSALRPGPFTLETDSVSILQDAWWSLGPSARKNWSQRDSIPDRPTRSEPLRGICYLGLKERSSVYEIQEPVETEYFWTYVDSALSNAECIIQ